MLHRLTFNPFQENTYVLANGDGEAIVFDPGMSDGSERQIFDSFLRQHSLTLKRCYLTHAHIDHILGLGHVRSTYGLEPHTHPGEQVVYTRGADMAGMYGLPLDELPACHYDLTEGTTVAFGNLELQIRLAPGHSPASICFYVPSEELLIGGDVLFRDSIGRTDLPGGNHELLLRSIREQLYTLPPATTVWPGHGPETTVRYERANNPFVRPVA